MSAKICPLCGSQSVTCIDTRTPTSDNPSRSDVICRRRYKCSACGDKFSTYEISAADFDELNCAVGRLNGLRFAMKAAFSEGNP